MWQRRSDLYSSVFPSSNPSLGEILEKSDINRSILRPNISIQRRNINRSILRPPIVVYITGEGAELRVCEAIESILRMFRIDSQRQLASSDFLSDLGNRLGFGFVKCPSVFFRGRYIGGLKDLQAYRLDAPFGLCTACGGHKFTLLHAIDDDDKLIDCLACSNVTQEGGGSSSQTKLFICFEGKDSQQRHVYVICSLDAQLPRLYNITKEAVINGYPSMGFGVYDSKIVLAGGESTVDNTTHNACITFDMENHSVDYNPFVLMTYGKYKPLIFQLGKRLYVCNSRYDSTSADIAPIEMYSPAVNTKWHTMSNIFSWSSKVSFRHLLPDYSCLVFGNTCFMSAVPFTDDSWRTHCNYIQNMWMPYSDSPLPFTGVATSHSQDGFDDFVMIYFDKGAVKVCKFDFSCFGDSQELFKPHQSDENFQGYFADFGMGCFCLTTFDKFRVHVCTFVVTREGTPSDPLKLTHRILSEHVFHYDKLCTDDLRITSVVGCSVPTQNKEAKSRAEKAEAIFYKWYRKMKDDFDPLEAENMDSLESLILEDVYCWSGEKYSEGEENSASDDNKCEQDEGEGA